MAQANSVPGFLKDSQDAIQEAIGITKFYGQTGWVHISAGLIRQGGVVTRNNETSVTVKFNEVFPKQVLGIFTTPAISELTHNLEGFTVPMAGGEIQFFWEAIGL